MTDGPHQAMPDDWLSEGGLPCVVSEPGARVMLAYDELMAHAKEGRIGAELNTALQEVFLDACSEVRADAGGVHCHTPEDLTWVQDVIQQTGALLVEIGGDENLPDPERESAPAHPRP